ncbi:MAG: hypothetical protein P1U34_03050 [Coxiellaceae bacterium]|nr:hypothetical protein [Coxiellaceae bacterium]
MRDNPYTSIKAQIGVLAGMLGNLTGAPFDRFRLDVVADRTLTHSLKTHFRNSLAQGVGQMYLGSGGRGLQKSSISLCMAITPRKYTDAHPILSASFTAAVAAWFGNIGRVGQINKLNGMTYPQTVSHIMKHKTKYLINTAQFSFSEGVRGGVCFGTAFYLKKKFGKVDSYKQQVINATKTSFIVSGMETTASWFFETLSARTAQLNAQAQLNSMKQLFNLRYATRTSGTLMIKNVAANWPLITTLFLGSHLVEQLQKQADDEGAALSTTKSPSLFSAILYPPKSTPKPKPLAEEVPTPTKRS